MKIKTEANAIDYNELKAALEEHFQGKYTFKERSKNFVVAAKSKTAGANILVRKNAVMVNGNFPTMGGQMLFVLTILLLGVLIPLIVYFAAYHKKMKAVENEIGDFIKDRYADHLRA